MRIIPASVLVVGLWIIRLREKQDELHTLLANWRAAAGAPIPERR